MSKKGILLAVLAVLVTLAIGTADIGLLARKFVNQSRSTLVLGTE